MINKKSTQNIFYVGYNTFPYGFAQTQKELLIAKGLVYRGCNVTVLCRYGTYKKDVQKDVPATGIFEGVNFKYFSGSAYRPDSFIKRNILKAFALVNEIFYLFKHKIVGKADAIIITANTFDTVLLYTILGKIFRIPTVIDIQEYWQAVKRHKNVLGDKLFDKYSFRLADKALCISTFLIEHAAKTRNESALLKIPCAVDFSKFDTKYPAVGIDYKYLLFCGSAVYFEVIEFIIDAYNLVKNKDFHLVLVCSNGRKEANERIIKKISESKKNNLIHFKSNLPYSELIGLYQNSQALLIPLRGSIEDTARFPHKIGEYCASKRPIITTNNGEMKYYFKDGINGYVSSAYDVTEYSKKMEEATTDLEKAELIAVQSHKMGLENFDYKVCGDRIYNFIFE